MNVNVSMVNIDFLYFSGFRFVTVNSVYKLQFFYIYICCFITSFE